MEKMAPILQTTFSNAKIWYFDLNFSEVCPIDNKSTLVQVMAWRKDEALGGYSFKIVISESQGSNENVYLTQYH